MRARILQITHHLQPDNMQEMSVHDEATLVVLVRCFCSVHHIVFCGKAAEHPHRSAAPQNVGLRRP